MKKYQKAKLTILSIVQNSLIASVSIEDFMTANGYESGDIKGATEGSYAINS